MIGCACVEGGAPSGEAPRIPRRVRARCSRVRCAVRRPRGMGCGASSRMRQSEGEGGRASVQLGDGRQLISVVDVNGHRALISVLEDDPERLEKAVSSAALAAAAAEKGALRSSMKHPAVDLSGLRSPSRARVLKLSMRPREPGGGESVVSIRISCS